MPDDAIATPTTDAPAATPAPAPETTPAPVAAAVATPAPRSSGLGFEEFLRGDSEGPKEPSPSASEDARPAAAEGAGDEPAAAAAVAAGTKEPAKPGAWDSDDNPHKKRADELEKRVKDTRDNFTQVTQQLAELKKANEILGKKVDGTYDPATDDGPSPDVQAAQAREREVLDIRTKASRDAAYRIYGREAVDAAVFAEGSPYSAIEEKEPGVHQHRVLASDSPVIAAMELLEERAFTGKWGSTPKDIESRIRADERALAEKDITERLEKKYADRSTKRNAQVTGVADAKGGGVPAAPAANGFTPLSALGNPHLA